MSSLATHSDPSYPPNPDAAAKALFSSTWRVLDSSPPPSLREILNAYRSKGDGDRDMLLAMLNAKSAEDQRLASLASLHRTMLELYQTPVPSSQSTYHSQYTDTHYQQHHFPSPPNTSYHSSPMQSHPYPLGEHSARSRQHRADEPSSSVRSRTNSSVASQSRKRRRGSPSPLPRERIRTNSSDTYLQDPPLPPSPYSSASTHSSAGSPRSRESMAIGSLLSSDSQDLKPSEPTGHRRTSSERSTSSASPSTRH
ncbi:hypothetical protein C8Q75DRAFT_774032 [Abortiporus biennis]|nr:hypothetical protein C8Q75DRAFT_774032 [Abortiporus biennis]